MDDQTFADAISDHMALMRRNGSLAPSRPEALLPGRLPRADRKGAFDWLDESKEQAATWLPPREIDWED